MQAKAGDVLVVESAHVGEARRTGVITEVRGEQGAPPYLVRWSGTDHDVVVFPGPDAHVEPGTGA